MPIVESIATGITILGAAKSTFDWLTGNSVAKKVDHLSGQVERLSQNIYYNPHQEVIDLSVSNQQVISDLRDIKNAAKPIQRALGKDLVVSTPIVSPQRLKQTFNRNPEDVLFNISALTGQGMPAAHLDDPTLVPVTFTRWGQAFVGYIKIGYARDYLDLEYSPDRSLYLPSTASPAAEVHSATSHAEPSDSATWSKVVSIIAENLGYDEDEVSPGSRLVADLSADSLDIVELVMAFEEEFGIEVPDVDAERMVTAGDIYNYIVNR